MPWGWEEMAVVFGTEVLLAGEDNAQCHSLPARRSGWGSPVASCSLHFLPGGNRIQPQANLEARWKAVP